MALFRNGKIVALAVNDTTIHDCSSTANTPGVDKKKCGKSVPDAKITVGAWLKSIGNATKDALSPPHRGSSSMGKGVVQTKGEEKGLAVFETRRYTPPRNRTQPASGWIDFAEDILRQAAACRPRPGSGTELIYDGSRPFNPAACP
jgi:hypothetical protein